jgi:sterol desaturase/sphingolipid hydroxylase (fatty acid hydroxylase superfamily)
MFILYFVAWTFMIYWLHRTFHVVPILKEVHLAHHRHVTLGTGSNGWNWKHMFLWIDDWKGTVDQWLMEIIPTIIFCWVFGQWWLLFFYWLWTAFIQERIEHNKNFNMFPILTSGSWHLVHHRNCNVNFGVFFPIWDIIFKTDSENGRFSIFKK